MIMEWSLWVITSWVFVKSIIEWLPLSIFKITWSFNMITWRILTLTIKVGDKAIFYFYKTPQVNNQSKLANKIILDGITRMLDKVKGKWLKELPSVLVIQDHLTHCDQGNTIQAYLQLGSNDFGWVQIAH